MSLTVRTVVDAYQILCYDCRVCVIIESRYSLHDLPTAIRIFDVVPSVHVRVLHHK